MKVSIQILGSFKVHQLSLKLNKLPIRINPTLGSTMFLRRFRNILGYKGLQDIPLSLTARPRLFL